MHSFESGMEYLTFTLPLYTSKIKVLSNLEWQKMLFSEHWKCPKGGLSTHKREFPTIYISSMHFSSSNHIDRFHCSPCECNTRRFTTALYHTPNIKRTCLEKQQIPGSLQRQAENFFCTDQGAFQRLQFTGPITKAKIGQFLGPFIFYAAAEQPNSGPPNLQECASSTFSGL